MYKILKEKKGTVLDDGTVLWERVIKEHNVLIFQTITKDPFIILSYISFVVGDRVVIELEKKNLK